jgi:hypothetical protein
MRRHSTIGWQPPQVQSAWQTSWPQLSPFAHARVAPGAHPPPPLHVPHDPHPAQRHVEASQLRTRIWVPSPHEPHERESASVSPGAH